jgi:undecaprenyl-diphosphatase
MDQKLFFLINRQWTGRVSDLLMAVLSSLDFWMPILLVLIAAVLVFGGFKARALLVTIALTVAVTDGIVVKTLKDLVKRPRPEQVEVARVVKLKKTTPRTLGVFHPLNIDDSKPKTPKKGKGPITGVSFPSGHTANNFAVAAVLMAFYRRRGWLFLPIAAGVGYSRIYTGSHWPTDVVFSTFLGLGLGFLMVWACKSAWSRWGGKLAPSLYRRHPSLLEDNKVLAP